MLIDSHIVPGPTFPAFDSVDVKNEPMLFNARGDWAYMNGGPITQRFLGTLLNQGTALSDVVFDSRVTMLMKGWWPCIPGWHHDDVPREREDGQPEYTKPSYRSQHAFALAGDDICRTQFALGEAKFKPVPLGELIYRQWHREVEAHIMAGRMSVLRCRMHQVYYFDDRAWHQGVRADAPGWRWFGRASWNTARVAKVANEIRRQVQVYLEHPMEGW